MARFRLLVLVGMVSAVLPVTLADVGANPPAPDPETTFHNTLLVQRAMEQARYSLLQEANAKKAVEILEEQLSRINGNAVYLRLLRDAYRAYIKDLYLAQQTVAAQKYLARLCILDRDATSDPSLRPPQTAKATVENKGPIRVVGELADKGTNLVKQLLPRAAWLRPEHPKSATVRAKIEEDPFDLSFKHGVAKTGDRGAAEEFLAQAEREYSQRRFSAARALYEQAHQTHAAVTAACRSRWGYCKLNYVVEQMNESSVDAQAFPALEREIQLAMEMSPALKDTGSWLLRELEGRRQKTATAVAVQHVGRNAQGWQVAETANFRIHHQQARDLVETVARAAEGTRLDMFRKWFERAGPDWNPKCDIYLYASGKDYNRATGENPLTPGHANIQTDKSSGRIVSRRIHLHCDVPNMVDCVLPHETTHVVLAGQFGAQPLPRWADEGIAVLIEPGDRLREHQRNLVRSHMSGELFSVRELVQMPDWPNARRVTAFYAQSVHLVDYLTRQRGPRAFTEFLRDGARSGYEQALDKHYGIRGFSDLQNRWQQQVLAEVNRDRPGVASR